LITKDLVSTSANRKTHWSMLAILCGMVLVMFADVFLSAEPLLLSKQGTDGDQLFLPWREFGFGQLRQGNLALWNPHILCGCPFMGGFQAALLYPVNWIHLVLPIHHAFNAEIALHVLIAGLGMYAWSWYRGASPLAALLAGVLLMFGAPFFFHLYPGHLTPLAVMAWSPLILLASDGANDRPSLAWCLLGAALVALQFLAGYPQYFFYTMVAVGLYRLLSFTGLKPWCWSLFCTCTMYAGGLAVASAELMLAWQASGESVRGNRGLPYELAASFSFPPENFVTLVAPNFFGNMDSLPYWGRCYLWEMSLFMGVTGIVLAIAGICFGDAANRRSRLVAAAMVVLLLVLALGAHTPLFQLLYRYVPGFNKFRSNSKFIYPAAIFLCLLAAGGLDQLVLSARRGRMLGVAALAIAVLTGVAGLWIGIMGSGRGNLWTSTIDSIQASGESYFPTELFEHPEFSELSARQATSSLYIGGGVGLLLATLLFAMPRFPRATVIAIAVLAITEVLVWSWHHRPSFPLAAARQTELTEFMAAQPGDERSLNISEGYSAMKILGRDIAGYEPVVSRRYAEFIAMTQGEDPDQVDAYLDFRRYHDLYRMLRCRYLLLLENNRWQVGQVPGALPRLSLVNQYRVVTGRKQIFEALTGGQFNPAQQVVLESEPHPQPVQFKTAGTTRIVDASTDHLIIEAELAHPAILLVTDSYSEAWRAVALTGSVQQHYQVMPANYVLRAIPLEAGRHRLRLEYSPVAYRAGCWISLISLAGFVLLSCWQTRHWLLLQRDRREAPSNGLQAT
jgi:hypothetical protein